MAKKYVIRVARCAIYFVHFAFVILVAYPFFKALPENAILAWEYERILNLIFGLVSIGFGVLWFILWKIDSPSHSKPKKRLGLVRINSGDYQWQMQPKHLLLLHWLWIVALFMVLFLFSSFLGVVIQSVLQLILEVPINYFGIENIPLYGKPIPFVSHHVWHMSILMLTAYLLLRAVFSWKTVRKKQKNLA